MLYTVGVRLSLQGHKKMLLDGGADFVGGPTYLAIWVHAPPVCACSEINPGAF